MNTDLPINNTHDFPNEGISDVSFGRLAINPAVAAVGLHKIAELPEVKEKIDVVKDTVSDIVTDVKDAVSDFCMGVFDKVKDYFNASKEVTDKVYAHLSKEFSETREFGIEKCSEAAREIFTPEVIFGWNTLSDEARTEIATSYADKVAEAFELVSYEGVIIERLEDGVLGYNNGDGTIHISDCVVSCWNTPFEIMNTITHELRHQYQDECIRGYHDVADNVRQEWAVATAIYNYDTPTCYDPWGYMYNPLEVDSRYAGETVVRNVSNDLFNTNVA